MKIDEKGYITLTPKESDSVMDLLYTVESLGGSGDDELTKDAHKAGCLADKILELKQGL